MLVVWLAAPSPTALAQSAAPAARAPSVTVAPVVIKDVAPPQTFVGRVVAIQAVQIVPRVTAFIEDVPAQQGHDVKAGDVLFRLEQTQYAAAVQAAQAQLASANAALRQSELNYQRVSTLQQRSVETQANLDQAQASRDQNQASVQAAKANLDQANLNLSYTTLTSPIDGRIGAVSLTKGNLVTPSTPALATVNQLDPIRVVFSVSAARVVAAQQRTGTSAAHLAKGLNVNLLLADGSRYGETGSIAFLGNEVDRATGTVSVYADFPNPQELLLPGAFVTVEVSRATPQPRPVVPVAAVQTQQSGSFVLTVGADNKVSQQAVQLGQQIGQDFIVNSGLTGGERVIIEGVQKVHPGETVNPTTAPSEPAQGGATGAGQNQSGR
ncbi:MAG TPA: efflux RND transporter periplasmic adaptor subunit [Xanthobacteraceae bacterium]|nr:efflux RND transporter periplasmic adaptor subunit [Xanthobacteraceae bacterium]